MQKINYYTRFCNLLQKLLTNIENEYYTQINKNYISYRERTLSIKEQKRIKQKKKRRNDSEPEDGIKS